MFSAVEELGKEVCWKPAFHTSFLEQSSFREAIDENVPVIKKRGVTRGPGEV